MLLMSRRLVRLAVTWLHLILLVSADYQCVCNYSENGVPVYENTTRTAIFLGALDINDCKQYLYPAREQSTTFYAIMFRHQIGYVMDIYINKTSCLGMPPANDIATVSSMSTGTFSVSTTLTPKEGLHSSGHLSTSLPKTGSTRQTRVTYSSLIGAMTSSTATMSTKITGNVYGALHACEVLTHQSNTAFAYSNYCYELVTQHNTFQVAEADCMGKGGHLAHIKNDQEQQILTSNAKHYQGDDYIWIGLHDSAHEEHFEWTSGEPVSYTHWNPGRKDFLLHFIEDCVVLKVGSFVNDGAWDDMPCSRVHPYICQFDLPDGPNLLG